MIVRSLREAGKLLGLSADTVRQKCLNGELSGLLVYVNPKGRWFVEISEDSVAYHIQSGTSRAQAGPSTGTAMVLDPLVEIRQILLEVSSELNQVRQMQHTLAALLQASRQNEELA